MPALRIILTAEISNLWPQILAMLAALRWTISTLYILLLVYGDQTIDEYSRLGCTYAR